MKFKIIPIIAFFTILILNSAQAQFAEVSKIVSPDRGGRDEFGSSVDIMGDYAVVGSWRDDVAEGSAFIYKKNENDQWEISQSFKAFDNFEMAEFGSAVKMSEDYVIIASGRCDIDGVIRAGALYVYENDGTNNWEFSTKLTASDHSGDAKLGMNSTSLALQGNTIVGGAPGDLLWNGAVYIFDKVDDEWVETKIIDNTGDDFEAFGISVSISGDFLAIGANGKYDSKGAVQIFEKDKDGNWTFNQEIQASDAQENDYFGTSISLQNDVLFVGAYGKNNETGATYVFKKNEVGQWIETQIIIPDNLENFASFGWVTEIDGEYAVVGAYYNSGSVFVYKVDENGTWNQTQELKNSDSEDEDQFGFSADIKDNQIIVGAIFESHDENGENYIGRAGSAYIFQDPLVTGIEPQEKIHPQLVVFPVPSSDILNLKSVEYKIIGIKLLNNYGQVLDEYNIAIGSKSHSIDITKLPEGTYILDIILENNNSVFKKFVKL